MIDYDARLKREAKAAGMIELTKDMDKSLSYDKIIEDLARKYNWDDELVSKMHEHFESQLNVRVEEIDKIVEEQVNKTVEDSQFKERLKEKIKEKERLKERLKERNEEFFKVADEINKIVDETNKIVEEQVNKMAEDPQFKERLKEKEDNSVVCMTELIKNLYKVTSYKRIITGLVWEYNWDDELVSRLIDNFRDE